MKPSPSSSRQSRRAMRFAPGARPAHHAIATKNGAEYSMRSVISDDGIDRRPRVRELDQDRLEREAEDAEHREQRSATSAVGQSHRTTMPLHAVSRISRPKAIRYHANGTKSWRLT